MIDLEFVDKVETYVEAAERVLKKYAPWFITFAAGYLTAIILNIMWR